MSAMMCAYWLLSLSLSMADDLYNNKPLEPEFCFAVGFRNIKSRCRYVDSLPSVGRLPRVHSQRYFWIRLPSPLHHVCRRRM